MNEVIEYNQFALKLRNQELMKGTMFTKDLFEMFIEYTETNPKTMENYKTFLKLFARYLKENNISRPTFETIHDYKRFLDEYRNPETNRKLSPGSKNQYFQAVKHLFNWLSSLGIYQNIAKPFKPCKLDDTNHKKDSFSIKDIRKIIDGIDTTTTTGKRNKAMLLLAINGGLRIIEIQRANLEDIEEIDGKKKLWIQGKGKQTKNESIELQPLTQEALEEYLSTRPNAKKDEPLFTGTSNNGKGTRITEQSLSRIFKTIMKESGFDSKRLTSHSIRHTANSILFNATNDLYKTQRFARHKDPKTTEIYIHTQEKENDQAEKIIFETIFDEMKSNEVEKKNELLDTINHLTNDEIGRVLDFIQTMKGGETRWN